MPDDMKELPEWLQRELDDHRAREAVDRLKIGIAAIAIGVSGLVALCAIFRSGLL